VRERELVCEKLSSPSATVTVKAAQPLREIAFKSLSIGKITLTVTEGHRKLLVSRPYVTSKLRSVVSVSCIVSYLTTCLVYVTACDFEQSFKLALSFWTGNASQNCSPCMICYSSVSTFWPICVIQEAQLSQRDRATRYVSWNLVSCCLQNCTKNFVSKDLQ